MKCPLQEIGVYKEDGTHHWVPRDCLKEECAWWHEGDQSCSVKDLASNLFLISLSLAALVTKMLTPPTIKR